VVLNIRRTHWAWLFAIVSSATYGIVFFGARLYGDAGLQGVFIAASAWGWYEWLRGGDGAPLVVTRSTRRLELVAARLAARLRAAGVVPEAYTDTDVPHMDGFLTAGSLLGTLLRRSKKVENWHVWIAVDVLYVGLYVYKGLHLTAILYACSW
jgi:nicotinamide mononucleotide transporter